MYLGRIVEHGHIDEVNRLPQAPYTQALLSSVAADPIRSGPGKYPFKRRFTFASHTLPGVIFIHAA